MENEMQKQTAMMVAISVTKEGKRLEAALGGSLEKAVKANSDALKAHLQEENTKQEKAAKECMQQLTNTRASRLTISGPTVSWKLHYHCDQKGVGDKAVNQLEKSVSSMLEAVVARQIQAQFLTSGKQALQVLNNVKFDYLLLVVLVLSPFLGGVRGK